MNYWSILGIEPTKDIRAIKRQYAARLRSCHPEEHPDEIMELEEAYRAAMDYVKAASVNKEEEQGEDQEGVFSSNLEHSFLRDKVDKSFENYDFLSEMPYEQQLSQRVEIKAFMQELNEKYRGYMRLASNPQNYWYNLLNSPQCQKLIKNPLFLEELIKFFNSHKVIFSKPLIKKELLPFFQSLEKYNYGEQQVLLLDFIDWLTMIVLSTKKYVELSEYLKIWWCKYFWVVIAAWISVFLIVNAADILSFINEVIDNPYVLKGYLERLFRDIFIEVR